jgi:hypothetical protein
MKPSRTIVDKTVKKQMGRPRSVGGDVQAPAISVRLRPDVMAHVERWASSTGRKRSDVARELIEEAIADRIKRTSVKRKPKAE